MLIKCPECELQVSDKALSCPHCGFPLVKTASTKPRKKHKRLPNGFGQITEDKVHNLRNRFRAMVTVGKTVEGKPIVRTLKPKCYFATYNEAYQALVEYHKNPYDLDDTMTVSQLYDKWSEEYFKSLKNDSSIRTITSAWAYCSSVYDMQAKQIRARHIKGCMEDGTAIIKGIEKKASANMKSRIKSLFNLMLDYALEYELVEKNYARTFNLSDEIVNEKEESKRGHLSFTDEEMDLLWENLGKKEYVDVLIIQCYSGWRPQELGLIRLENVDLEKWTFSGGMKTEAGTNRVVPIHPRIRDLVQSKYNEALELHSDYLLNCTDTTNMKLTYDKYKHRFDKLRDELGLNPLHRPHDGRMQFVTMAKKYTVDEYAIKYIVGHKIQDITEKVYTDRDIEWLASEMKKIK